MKHDYSAEIAAAMDAHLKSDENRKMFGPSAVMEKLAFHRVSDEETLRSETEDQMRAILDINQTSTTGVATKTAGEACKGCDCKGSKGTECHCECHRDTDKNDADDVSVSEPMTAEASFESVVADLLNASEALEDLGMETLAGYSARLAGFVVTAAKKSKDSKKGPKGPKMGIKERMEKMRRMKGGKGKPSKSTGSKPAAKSSKPEAAKSSPEASKSSETKPETK